MKIKCSFCDEMIDTETDRHIMSIAYYLHVGDKREYACWKCLNLTHKEKDK